MMNFFFNIFKFLTASVAAVNYTLGMDIYLTGATLDFENKTTVNLVSFLQSSKN